MIWRQPSSRYYTMQVGMMLESLSPGMENGKESDLGPQVLGISGNLEEGGGCSTKE